MIHHVVPWMTGNIGGGLNAAIERLPDDAWICARDGDTLFLMPQWGKQIEAIVEAQRNNFAVIGAMTNRIRSPEQLHGGRLSEEADIGQHVAIAKNRWNEHGTAVKPMLGPAAGMLMLFSKQTWLAHPFPERSIHFDQLFCDAARANGGRVGVALGLYLFHLYRWGHANPASYVGHLA